MIGFRLWNLGTTNNILDEDTYSLASVSANYVWPSSLVGDDINILLNQDKPGTVGYDFKESRYLLSNEVDIYSRFEDAIFWDEVSNNFQKHCPYYGFYAYKSLTDVLNSDLFQEIGSGIIGLVSGYGICHKHKYGFRSQYMKVIAIAPTDEDSNYAVFLNQSNNSFQLHNNMKYNDAIDIIGKNLSIPVVTIKELRKLGMKYEVS